MRIQPLPIITHPKREQYDVIVPLHSNALDGVLDQTKVRPA